MKKYKFIWTSPHCDCRAEESEDGNYVRLYDVQHLQAENERLKSVNSELHQRLEELGDMDIPAQIEIYSKRKTEKGAQSND